jgi:hypothetical protein
MPRPLCALLLLTIAATSAGCRTSCQQLCKEMAAYAEECGTPFPEEDLDQCLSNFARRNTEKADRDVCEEFLPTLREEWDCEDLDAYLDGGSSGGSGDASGGSDTATSSAE